MRKVQCGEGPMNDPNHTVCGNGLVHTYVGYAYGARQLYRVVYFALSAAHNMQYVHTHTHTHK